MSELAGVSTVDLAKELVERGEQALVKSDGTLGREAYALGGLLGIRFSVDGAPARVNSAGEVELMATGPYAGRLCLVGGGVGRYFRTV